MVPGGNFRFLSFIQKAHDEIAAFMVEGGGGGERGYQFRMRGLRDGLWKREENGAPRTGIYKKHMYLLKKKHQAAVVRRL